MGKELRKMVIRQNNWEINSRKRRKLVVIKILAPLFVPGYIHDCMYRTRQSWRQRVIIHIKNKHYGLISKNKNEIQIYRFPITLKF